jgi:hypothetical protein
VILMLSICFGGNTVLSKIGIWLLIPSVSHTSFSLGVRAIPWLGQA